MEYNVPLGARIAVLCGGMSSEREVSLRSGKNVLGALKRLGYENASLLDVSPNIMNDLKSSQAEDYAHRLMTDATFRNNEGTARNSYLSARKAAADAGNKTFDGEYKTTKTAMGGVKSAATTAETDMRQIMRRANNQQKK